MRPIKYTRWPAAVVFFASVLSVAAYAWASQGRGASSVGRDGGRQDSGACERSIAAGQADGRAWFAYAEQLRAEGKFRLAAEAYQRATEKEPYHRESRFWTAVCLATVGDVPRLQAFMEQLAASEAKLAVEIFQRGELAPYLQAPAMARLLQEARDQAKD